MSNDVQQAIATRMTHKFISNQNLNFSYSDEMIQQILHAAFCAPFHYPCHKQHQQGELDSILPWRAYVIDKTNCRSLREQLIKAGDETKIPALLAATSHVILLTWLPDPKKSEDDPEILFEPTIRNMEHIAAASAAIQNMLITCSHHAIPNYWSSGGTLAKKQNLQKLGIDIAEILLAAVFLFPPEQELSAQELSRTNIVTGKWRNEKGDLLQCMRHISVNQNATD